LNYRKFRPPALVLYLLAPAVGELLSGSSPPAEYFTVFGFTLMTLLYGGGALLARELKVRWGKGIGTLMLLGASYGILEEGLMVASFQNPNWMDIGLLGSYGRWLGINWVWTVELTFYHSLVSVTIPVLLVELMYPTRNSEPWVHGRWTWALPILFLADIVFGYFVFPTVTGFYPPIAPYMFLVMMAGVFIFLAKRFPRDWARNGVKPMRPPLFYTVVCFFAALSCGVIFWVFPNVFTFPLGPLAVILVGVLFILGFLRYLVGFNWSESEPIHRYSLVLGCLLLFTISTVIQELDQTRLDNTSGMILVGFSFLLGLNLLRRRLIKQSKPILALDDSDFVS
jgi:hypothetical protein